MILLFFWVKFMLNKIILSCSTDGITFIEESVLIESTSPNDLQTQIECAIFEIRNSKKYYKIKYIKNIELN